jgi:hypothetical protein
MNGKISWLAVVIFSVVLAAGAVALAEDATLNFFSGQINDYTPETGVAGPYEMRGPWTLILKDHGTKADFRVELNMTHSDYWVFLNPTKVDDDTSTGRNPHTHLITVSDATVTAITGGFSLTGPVSVTLNGGATPFTGNCVPATQCTLTVDITGSSLVTYSNLAMTFGGVANGPTVHFGTQAIHGVVKEAKTRHDDDRQGGDDHHADHQ